MDFSASRPKRKKWQRGREKSGKPSGKIFSSTQVETDSLVHDLPIVLLKFNIKPFFVMKTIKKSLLLRQLGAIKAIHNLNSPRSYRPVANQFDAVHENGISFQSYSSLIAVRMNGYLYLTNKHDYSNTTSKYATSWTGFSTKERREGLESGRFILIEED